MITATVTRDVATSADHAFDVIVRHQPENHPRWEDEVLEVRQIDPPGPGARSVMVRHEHGRTRELENTCVEYVDGRLAAYQHDEPSMGFRIEFAFRPVDATSCQVAVHVRMQPRRAARLLTPLLELGIQRRSERITDRMIAVVEATPASVAD